MKFEACGLEYISVNNVFVAIKITKKEKKNDKNLKNRFPNIY